MTIVLVLAATLLTFSNANATTFTDLKFGQYQTADSQWNTSSCYYNPSAYNGCQIYSKNPGTTYKIPWYSGQVQWAAGDYIQFSASGDANYPWEAKQYDANGNVKAVLGTGKVIYSGLVNADGYFFFMGNDNNTGQLFSLSEGMDTTGGVTFSGEANPDVATLNNYAANYGSTTPLAAGESAQTSEPPPPSVCDPSYVTCPADKSNLQYNATHIQRKIDWENVNTGSENIVRIQQVGDRANIDIDQSLSTGIGGNLVMGHSTTDDTANITGDDVVIDIDQYGNDNAIGLLVDGNSNDITVSQTGHGHRARSITQNGTHNTVNISQHGNLNELDGKGHFADVYVVGSNNSVTTTQWNENQLLIVDNIADGNTISVNQKDGENYASIVNRMDDATIGVVQEGGGDHGINLNLTGETTDVGVNQNSAISQIIDITHHCGTLGGCAAISITQD